MKVDYVADLIGEDLLTRTKHFRDIGEMPVKDWHGDRNEVPKTAAYHPTGVGIIDRIVETLKPKFKYGGDGSYNAIRDDAYDENRQATKATDKTHFIVLPHPASFDDNLSYAATVAHELIHWAAARGFPGNAKGVSEFQMLFGLIPVDYTIEEISADVGSAMLMELGGVPPDLDKRAKYLMPYTTYLPDTGWEGYFKQAIEMARRNVQWLLDKAGINLNEPTYGSDA